MQKIKQKQIDLEILPQEARKKLLDFYEYLVSRYRKNADKLDKENRLKKILSNPVGVLPADYKFDREEAHER